MADQGINVSWFDKIKQTLTAQDINQKIRDSKGIILEMILYLSIGFITSFVLKRYGQYVLFFVISLFILVQLNILNVDVNWSNIQHFLGLQHTIIEGNVFTIFWEWVKLNVVVVLSFCVGFIIGLKVG